jgi:hypothetical protein
MYPHSFAGLTAAYVVGLPYFRRELVSDVLFASVFFSVPLILATIRENVAGRRAAA